MSIWAAAAISCRTRKRHRHEDFGPAPRSFTFNQGIAGEAGAGYGLGNGFRVELNGDFTYNHVHGAKAAFPLRAGGTEEQYGGFADVLYDFNLGLPVTPYLGAGAGAQAVYLDKLNSHQLPVCRGADTEPDANAVRLPGRSRARSPPLFIPGLVADSGIPLRRCDRYRTLMLSATTAGPRNRPVGDGLISNIAATFKVTSSATRRLIGLRYALFQPAPPPPPPPPQAAPPAPAPEAARTYLVFFDWDRADLYRPRAPDRGRSRANQHPGADHPHRGERLHRSVRHRGLQPAPLRPPRRKACRPNWFVTAWPQKEISIHGYGESNPLVPTAKGVREPQNRRVEIILR